MYRDNAALYRNQLTPYKVRENLPFEKGVKDLKVTLADKTVWVKYSPKKTTKEQLAAAINKLGYQVLGEKQTEEQPAVE